MRKLVSLFVFGLFSQSLFAHGWQAAAMWDWALNIGNPTLQAHEDQLAAQQAELATQQAALAAQQAEIDGLKDYVEQLQAYIEVDDLTNPTRPVVRVVAANFQVVNGAGSTGTVNGTGNLIVGYDEPDPAQAACSNPLWTDQFQCEFLGFTWTEIDAKYGSHNVVAGTQNNYTSSGGIVAGRENTISGLYATVTGGSGSEASGTYASVSGGGLNIASGLGSSVSGGYQNLSSSERSSVSGGYLNDSVGFFTSVSGGVNNSAGVAGTSGGQGSSISGGHSNTATGDWSGISGGNGLTVTSDYEWAAGP